MILIDAISFGPVVAPIAASVAALGVSRLGSKPWVRGTIRGIALGGLGLALGMAVRLVQASRLGPSDSVLLAWSPIGRAPIALGLHIDSLSALSTIVALLVALAVVSHIPMNSVYVLHVPIVLAATGLAVASFVLNDLALFAIAWSILAFIAAILALESAPKYRFSKTGSLIVATFGGVGLTVGGAAVAAANAGSALLSAGPTFRDAGVPLVVLFMVLFAACGMPPFPSMFAQGEPVLPEIGELVAVRGATGLVLLSGYCLGIHLLSYTGPSAAAGWRWILLAAGALCIVAGVQRLLTAMYVPHQIAAVGTVAMGLAIGLLTFASRPTTNAGFVLAVFATAAMIAPGIVNENLLQRVSDGLALLLPAVDPTDLTGHAWLDDEIQRASFDLTRVLSGSADQLVRLSNQITERYDRAVFLIVTVVIVLVFAR